MSDSVPEPDRERLAWMYRQMLRIREFEERVKGTFTEHPGVIRGHTHLADGAEASIVGSLAALRPGDQVMSTYRCHGYPLVLGSDPKAMMAEIYGRATGLCGGYGGSMHLADPERGFLGTSGIVGQGIPQATDAGAGRRIASLTRRARSRGSRFSRASGSSSSPPARSSRWRSRSCRRAPSSAQARPCGSSSRAGTSTVTPGR
jgi:TPP-dependent pyruvate/acetoin dehydrogenase alpha subunit